MADIEVTIRKEMRTMWISRKKFQILEKRIADLEKKVRNQQEKIMLLREATVTGKKNDFVS